MTQDRRTSVSNLKQRVSKLICAPASAVLDDANLSPNLAYDPLYESEAEDYLWSNADTSRAYKSGRMSTFFSSGIPNIQAANANNSTNNISSVSTSHHLLALASLRPSDFREEVCHLLSIYFEEGDALAVHDGLRQLNCFAFHDDFIFQALCMCLESESEEMERATSSLLTMLTDANLLNEQHFLMGLERTFEELAYLPEGSSEILMRLIDFSCADGVLPLWIRERLPATFLTQLSHDFVVSSNMQVLEDASCNLLPLSNQISILKEVKKVIDCAVRCCLEGGLLEETQEILLSVYDVNGCKNDSNDSVPIANEVSTTKTAIKNNKSTLTFVLHEFVRRAVVASMEGCPRQRERVSFTLAALFGSSILSSVDLKVGFIRVLTGLKDLMLDIPKAPNMLTSFVLRAIVDDVLAPAFVGSMLRLRAGGPSGRSCMRQVQRYLERGGSFLPSRVQNVWLGEDATSSVYLEFKENTRELVTSLYQHSTAILTDALVNQRAQKFLAGFQKMNNLLPPYHVAEIIRKVVIGATETALHPEDGLKIYYNVVKTLYQEHLIFEDDLQQAFDQIYEKFDELTIDIPNLKRQLRKLEDVTSDLMHEVHQKEHEESNKMKHEIKSTNTKPTQQHKNKFHVRSQHKQKYTMSDDDYEDEEVAESTSLDEE